MTVDQVSMRGYNTKRNPLSPRALRAYDIKPGIQFLWYVPPPSPWKRGGWPYTEWYYRKLLFRHDPRMRWGKFISKPYVDDEGDHVVKCIFGESNAVQKIVMLSSLGITNSRYDENDWDRSICIPR